MAIRVGERYLYFVMAMAGAGAITHSMVPPTPGPLMIAEFLQIELGYALVAGLLGEPAIAVLVLWMAGWFEDKYAYPMREVGGISSRDLEDTLAKISMNYRPYFFPISQSYFQWY